MNKWDDNHLKRLRAQFAYDEVNGNWPNNALQRVKGLPVQVRTQGLTVTLATLLREDTVQSRRLADVLGRWLLKDAPHRSLDETGPEKWSPARRLLDACIKAERSAYLAAQVEALFVLEQLKLFAEALDKEEK